MAILGPTTHHKCMSVRGLVVMIVACQVMDPGSIPGERIFALGLNHTCVRKVFCCPGCHYRQDIGILFCSFSNPIHETFIKGRIPHCRPPPSPGMEQQSKKKLSGQPESNQ